jgi:hypothetical protein
VVSVVMWVTVVVRVLVLSGRVFANYSPRLVSLGRVVRQGVRRFGIVDVKQLGQTYRRLTFD